jgi:hypothetical protein
MTFRACGHGSMEAEQARRRLVHWGVLLIGVSDGIDTAAKGHKMLRSFKGIMNEVFSGDPCATRPDAAWLGKCSRVATEVPVLRLPPVIP